MEGLQQQGGLQPVSVQQDTLILQGFNKVSHIPSATLLEASRLRKHPRKERWMSTLREAPLAISPQTVAELQNSPRERMKSTT
jgi:hypothetical protein